MVESTQYSTKKQYVFKFVVMGDSGVGKTSILHHFVYSKCNFLLNKVSYERNETNY